ncbi:MAG: RNA-binding S4 domain-containing protein [Bacteroidales bacterium]|nr:RNA-binding S4 domain-containing protein [Bacteroidales bacterium]
MHKVRIDKWLWAVRIYKTRSQASEACKKGRIIIDNIPVKPSREIKLGDVIIVRKMPVLYTFKVKELTERRLSAKLVKDYYEDLTSVDELNKLQVNETIFIKRDRGAGRPTKKERRIIDKIKNSD